MSGSIDLAALVVERHELQVRKCQVERLDLLADELVRPVQQLLVLGVGLEIPAMRPPCRNSGSVCVSRDERADIGGDDLGERAVAERARAPSAGRPR